MRFSGVVSILPRGLRDRRWWTVPLVWLVSLGLLLTVVAAAGGLGGALGLGRLPTVETLDYGRDAFGTVAPLERAFVLDSLGSPFFDQLRGDVAAAVIPTLHNPADRGGRDNPSGAPDDPRHPGELPPPQELAAGPDLRVAMDVDRDAASRGDTLEYVVTVTNVGEGVAKQVEVRSHVPEHTSLVSTPQCGGEPARVSPGEGPAGLPATCVDAPVGATAPGDHEIAIVVSGMNAGRTEHFVFRVAVNPSAPEGHRIRNHAHAGAEGAPERTSNEVTTVVR